MKSLVWILYALMCISTSASAYAAYPSVKDSLSRQEDLCSHPSDSVVSENFKLYYVCDETFIRNDYLDNARQIEKIIDHLNRSPRIDSIVVYAYASPEGGFLHNADLAQRRAETARKFILKHARQAGRTDLSGDNVILRPSAENWDGLYDVVNETYFRWDRDRILKIIKDRSVGPETRKWRIQQLDHGVSWRYLIRKLMPKLRYATWICVWEHPQPIRKKLSSAPIIECNVKHLLEQPSDTLEFELKAVPPRYKRTIMSMKTNLLSDAVTALNYSFEFPINENFSFVYQQHTPWWLSKDNRKCLEILTFGGEFRWWFKPKTFAETDRRKQRDALVGHYLGVYGFGGKLDVQWDKIGCYQAEPLSFGLSYGYSMPISRHLNLEFSISAGYARIPYRHYVPTPDWQILIKDNNNSGTLHYFGPTKLEITLSIPIRATVKRPTSVSRPAGVRYRNDVNERRVSDQPSVRCRNNVGEPRRAIDQPSERYRNDVNERRVNDQPSMGSRNNVGEPRRGKEPQRVREPRPAKQCAKTGGAR